MNEIYPLWVAAHGVLLITPVNWYQAPGALKAMIDRLVCADGGNPDPSSTHGKAAAEAKALELAGWPYPRHLAGRLFAVVVHGDTVGAEIVAPGAGGLGERHAHGARRLEGRSRRLHRLFRTLCEAAMKRSTATLSSRPRSRTPRSPSWKRWRPSAPGGWSRLEACSRSHDRNSGAQRPTGGPQAVTGHACNWNENSRPPWTNRAC